MGYDCHCVDFIYIYIIYIYICLVTEPSTLSNGYIIVSTCISIECKHSDIISHYAIRL